MARSITSPADMGVSVKESKEFIVHLKRFAARLKNNHAQVRSGSHPTQERLSMETSMTRIAVFVCAALLFALALPASPSPLAASKAEEKERARKAAIAFREI